MTSSDLYERIRFRGNPSPHPRAVVVDGAARFTVLTPRLLRMEWSATGQFEDRSTYAFPSRFREEAPPYQTWVENGTRVIDTGSLRVFYTGNSGRFTQGNLRVELDCRGTRVTWRPSMADPYNLRGTRRTLDMCEGDAPLADGLISRSGWAVFDDSRNVVFGDDGWVGPRPDFELQDWYFFGYGHDYYGALSEYQRFGGETPLIPRFVLGAWWSRYWAYSEQDLRGLVAEFEDHGVPLDVFVIDMDWHTPDGWTGYTWNRDLFPDPAGFLGWLHEKGLHVTLNLHPADGVHPHEAVYRDFARAMGVDPASRAPVPFQIADKGYVQHYFEMLHHPMEDEGVDFWWMDWQQGEVSEVKGLDPLPWINHLHFNDIKRRGVRPMLYSRWGGLGNHRYYIGFSGDTYVTWDALRFQPYMTATAANVLYGWWSHDIGGHMGGATEPELYARWVQFGALSPVLRLHATKDPRAERRPWAYDREVYEAAKAGFLLRYALIPYLYTMARVAMETGVALCRPMYYEHPEVDDAYAARYQYYLGDQLIAAPIVSPRDPKTGLARVDVWVPDGTWYTYDTLQVVTGPCWVRLFGDLNRMPLLARAGAIIPLAPSPGNAGETETGLLTTGALTGDSFVLDVFPGEGVARLYEDDGLSEAYRQGEVEWTEMATRQVDAATWELIIKPAEGCCPGLPARRRFDVRLRGSNKPDRVLVDGREVSTWRYDPDGLVTLIEVAGCDRRTGAAIRAVAVGGIVATGEAHNGLLERRDLTALGAAGVEKAGHPGAQDGEVRADAVARMGGPFAGAVGLSTLADVRRRLGYVIIGAPVDGGSYDIDAEFVCEQAGEEEVRVTQARGVTGSRILDVPFRFEGELPETMSWEARVRIGWQGESIESVHRGRTLFPTLHTFRALAYAEDDPARPELPDLVTGDGQLDESLPWFPVIQSPEVATNLAEPFIIRMWGEQWRDRLQPGVPQRVYLTCWVESPSEREALLEVRASEPLCVTLNGREVSFGATENDPRIQVAFREALLSAALRLHAGPNLLLVETRSRSGRDWSWHFSGRWLSLEKEPISDLRLRP